MAFEAKDAGSCRVAVMLGEGFEPVEALTPVDVLRRAGVCVTTVSVMPGREVVSAHGVPVVADTQVDAADLAVFDALVLPGGSVGYKNLSACEPLREALVEQDAEGRLVAAICAAPMLLAQLGLLDGRRATCYPGCEDVFPAGAYQAEADVVRDGNLITASGPAKSLPFALAVLEALAGSEAALSVARGMLA